MKFDENQCTCIAVLLLIIAIVVIVIPLRREYSRTSGSGGIVSVYQEHEYGALIAASSTFQSASDLARLLELYHGTGYAFTQANVGLSGGPEIEGVPVDIVSFQPSEELGYRNSDRQVIEFVLNGQTKSYFKYMRMQFDARETWNSLLLNANAHVKEVISEFLRTLQHYYNQTDENDIKELIDKVDTNSGLTNLKPRFKSDEDIDIDTDLGSAENLIEFYAILEEIRNTQKYQDFLLIGSKIGGIQIKIVPAITDSTRVSVIGYFVQLMIETPEGQYNIIEAEDDTTLGYTPVLFPQGHDHSGTRIMMFKDNINKYDDKYPGAANAAEFTEIVGELYNQSDSKGFFFHYEGATYPTIKAGTGVDFFTSSRDYKGNPEGENILNTIEKGTGAGAIDTLKFGLHFSEAITNMIKNSYGGDYPITQITARIWTVAVFWHDSMQQHRLGLSSAHRSYTHSLVTGANVYIPFPVIRSITFE